MPNHVSVHIKCACAGCKTPTMSGVAIANFALDMNYPKKLRQFPHR